MKDKEMIEEMAKVIKSANEINCIRTCDNCNYYNDDSKCISFGQAIALYEQGYRKLPKDSVVLSRERYEYLTICLEKFEEIMNDIKKQERKETAEKILKWVKEHYDGVGWKLVETYFKEQFNVEIVEKNIDNESFDCGYHEYAKEKHDKRVADTPNRIEFAKKQFEANNIDFTLKNEASGHFHCWRKSDNKLFQFYAGTGKITGVANKRGIHALIEILTK